MTGSRALRGSIGPVVTLRLPLPLVGMLSVYGCVWDCVAVCVWGLRCCVRSVCPAAACGAGGVGVILLWIGPPGQACVGLTVLRGPMSLRPRTGDSTLEAGRGAGSKGFNRGEAP